jgi:hypothetical protein
MRAMARRCAPPARRSAHAGAGRAASGIACRGGDANGLLQSQCLRKGSHDDTERVELCPFYGEEKALLKSSGIFF